MSNLIKYTHTHTQWHRMTRMTGPDCVVMCNLINTHTHLKPFARAKSNLLVKIHGPSKRELEDKTADGTCYVYTSRLRWRALFDNHPRPKNKALLLYITIVDPCTGSHSGECSTPCRKTPCRRSRAEEKHL